MDTLLIILFVFAILILATTFLLKKKNIKPVQPLPGTYRQLLKRYVSFYNQLDDTKKIEFENRVQVFLSQVRVSGIKTTVEDIDKILIASSAIIPIFGFPGWEYVNLHEVLLYPASFSHELELEGPHRNTTGMVGTGAYQHMMILSQPDLRKDFQDKHSRDNTAIHEFVHLVDKIDGSIDGIPEFILSKKYILPWLNLIHREIKQIMRNHSDINPYGATNEAEFFAVAAEYFFERPDLLQIKHPGLYNILSTIFRQQPQKPEKI
jgi:MtfA peptidase